MLMTTGSSNLAPRELATDEVVESGGRADETVVHLSKSVKKPSKVEKPQRPEKLQMSSAWRNQASWPPTLG